MQNIARKVQSNWRKRFLKETLQSGSVSRAFSKHLPRHNIWDNSMYTLLLVFPCSLFVWFLALCKNRKSEFFSWSTAVSLYFFWGWGWFLCFAICSFVGLTSNCENVCFFVVFFQYCLSRVELKLGDLLLLYFYFSTCLPFNCFLIISSQWCV